MTSPKLLATGPELLRQGVRGVEPVLQEVVEGAQQELQIVAYVLPRSAIPLLRLVRSVANRGTRICLVLNHFENQVPLVRQWLIETAERSPNFEIWDFSPGGIKEVHAKICVADRRRGVVGSANFSWGGLVSNYEVGVEVEGPIAWELSDLVDRLMTLSRRLHCAQGEGDRTSSAARPKRGGSIRWRSGQV